MEKTALSRKYTFTPLMLSGLLALMPLVYGGHGDEETKPEKVGSRKEAEENGKKEPGQQLNIPLDEKNKWLQIPLELWELFFLNQTLSPKDLRNVDQTCHTFRKAGKRQWINHKLHTGITIPELSKFIYIPTLIQHAVDITSLRLLNTENNPITNDTIQLVAKHFPNLTELNIGDMNKCGEVTDISPLEKLTNLTILNLEGCSKILDISPITKLTDLIELNLRGVQAQNMSCLGQLSSLIKLDLSCTPIIDTACLKSLNCLTILDLSYTQISSDNLRDLPQSLTSLSLLLCSRITDISHLNNLPNLTTLDLTTCFGIIDISPLTTLTKLTELKISHTQSVQDLSCLKNLPNLTKLVLQWFQDISSIAGFPKLTVLSLSGCTVQDFPTLKELPSLQTLFLPTENGTDSNMITGEALAEFLERLPERLL